MDLMQTEAQFKPRHWPSASAKLLLPYVAGCAAAAAIGLASNHLAPVLVGLAALLPVLAHVRHVGPRRAVTEPSPILFIVAFYFFVFPLRGLVIATSGYTDVIFGHRAVTGAELAKVLLLASMGTTALVEGYYFTKEKNAGAASSDRRWIAPAAPEQVVRLALILVALAGAGLGAVLLKYGGIAGAQAALLSHTAGPLTSDTSLTDSAWQLFAQPAVWCAAYVAASRSTDVRTRAVFGTVVLVLVIAMLLVYGSRLGALLGLTGAWIVFHYSGGRVPIRAVLAGGILFGVVSVIVVGSRSSTPAPGISRVEHYSRIAGYGMLDVSLAIVQDPTTLHEEITRANRWLDFPGYLVPSFLWPGRPNLNAQRLDIFVARAIGGPNDKNTGFPPSYLMEDWLLGGWWLVLVLSPLGGLGLGWVDRKLVGDGAKLTPGKLLAYTFVATQAFNYYKDGDLLTSAIGDVRLGVYLSLLLWITGVWGIRPGDFTDGSSERHTRSARVDVKPPATSDLGVA